MSKNLDAHSIYEKAVKFHVGHQCDSYAFCYHLLKLAHNRLPPPNKEKTLCKLKQEWNLTEAQILILLKQLNRFRIPEQQYPKNYLFPKKIYF